MRKQHILRVHSLLQLNDHNSRTPCRSWSYIMQGNIAVKSQLRVAWQQGYNFYPRKLNRDECPRTVHRHAGSWNTSKEAKGTPDRARQSENPLGRVEIYFSPAQLSSPNFEFHHIDSGLPSPQTSIGIYKKGPIYKLPADSPACGV